MRKNFRVLGTVFALALAVTAGCAATGGNAQSSVTSETQAETAVEPGNETAAGGSRGAGPRRRAQVRRGAGPRRRAEIRRRAGTRRGAEIRRGAGLIQRVHP